MNSICRRLRGRQAEEAELRLQRQENDPGAMNGANNMANDANRPNAGDTSDEDDEEDEWAWLKSMITIWSTDPSLSMFHSDFRYRMAI